MNTILLIIGICIIVMLVIILCCMGSTESFSPSKQELQSGTTSDSCSNVPIGTIMGLPSAKTLEQNDWNRCDGAQLDKTVYKDLFDVIGYTYTPENNRGAFFNLPNLNGRMLKGADLARNKEGNAGGESSQFECPVDNLSCIKKVDENQNVVEGTDDDDYQKLYEDGYLTYKTSTDKDGYLNTLNSLKAEQLPPHKHRYAGITRVGSQVRGANGFGLLLREDSTSTNQSKNHFLYQKTLSGIYPPSSSDSDPTDVNYSTEGTGNSHILNRNLDENETTVRGQVINTEIPPNPLTFPYQDVVYWIRTGYAIQS